MLARVFIGNAEVGMAVVHGLPTEQPSRTYTFAGSDQLCTETLHQHKEIKCDLYCKAYIVNDAFLTSDQHTKKFRFRDYMTGELYDGYSYISGTVEFDGSGGLRGRNCWFVSGDGVIPAPSCPQTFPYPVGFPENAPSLDKRNAFYNNVADTSCENFIEIPEQQGEAIAAMSPSGEITIFKEDFQRAAEYLAQCFGPPPSFKKEDMAQCFEPVMPQLDIPEEEEEKINGYTEGWDF